jgi:hypothetical protein
LACICPIGGLVAARHLVELLLEDVRQLALLRRSAAATAAALLDADLHFVLFFRLLQQRQRLVLGRQRLIGRRRAQFRFGVLHRRDGLRQKVGNLLELRILLDELAVHAREETFDLLAQLLLRQADDGGVLRNLSAELVRLSRCTLNVAEMICRCCSKARRSAAAHHRRLRHRRPSTAPAGTLIEGTDANEVQIAARLMAAVHAVVVRGARVVGHRVARLHAQLFEIERVTGADRWQSLRAS